MRAETIYVVETFWSELFGVPRGELFTSVTVVPHALLSDYQGYFIAARNGGAHISVPEAHVPTVTDLTLGASAIDLVSRSWWGSAFGAEHELIGPSTHHYLDKPPQIDPVGQLARVRTDDLASLQGATSADDWSEAGFEDDPEHLFAVYGDDGQLVAGANLSTFAGRSTDVGVLTLPTQRGKGFGRTAASAATTHAIEVSGLARWVCRNHNDASLALASKLDYEAWCLQVAVRLPLRG